MSQVEPHRLGNAPFDHVGSDRREAIGAGWAGVLGAIALGLYFVAPALVAWPYGGASPAVVAAYADAHAALFFGGAWLQVTGTLLCAVLILTLVRQSGAGSDLLGMVTVMATAVLLATVVIEAAFLIAVPVAAGSGDSATAASMFTLSNGVFLRVFPLAPASATLIGLGLILRPSNLLGPSLATIALGLGIAFEVAGIAAIFVPAAIAVVGILSAVQGLWFVAAGIRLATASRSTVALPAGVAS
jgi:hypothetical protein